MARLRLDRLVTLLETGSTQVIRNTAAQQLGDVQKQHPDELFNLLARVIPFLKSKSWDTRTAAAKAIAGIVENASPFDPNGDEDVKAEDSTELEREQPPVLAASADQLRLESLDIPAILTNGKKLLGSGGKDYDYAIATMDPASRLEFQRKVANVSLGLAGANVDEQIDKLLEATNSASNTRTDTARGPIFPKIDTSDSIHSDDQVLRSPSPITAASPGGDQGQTTNAEAGLSKRQLNQLKRKKKMDAKSQANKVRVVDLSGRRPSSTAAATPSTSEPFAIKSSIKSEQDADADTDMFSLKRANVDEDAKIVSDFKGSIVPEKSIIQSEAEEQGLEWPFERLCEVLMVDIFDHHWEIRHGAAMGLREVIRVHGAGAGRQHGKSKETNDKNNDQWLNDLACRLCCVLMLDRFGDYISDNVVAPIRETVGQTLGALMAHLRPSTVSLVYQVLYRMVMQEGLNLLQRIWEVCHGGMIGLRYLVAVRSDLLVKENGLMDGVVEAVMRGLADLDDDVRAVSAATLTPIAKEFVTLRPAALRELMNIVWDCLSDIKDDLSASTGFVMDLLAKLCSFPEVLVAMQENAAKEFEHSFTSLVPRLYPFLRHTITSVRSAVLRALQTFLKIGSEDTRGWVSARILRLVYQNLLVERNEVSLNLSFEVWNSLLEALKDTCDESKISEFTGQVNDMLTLAFHPIGTSRNPLPIKLCFFVKPSGQLYGPPNAEMLKLAAQQNTEPGFKRRRRSEKKEEPPMSAHNVDGHMISGDVDLVGADTLIRSRVFAAKALARALALYPSLARNQTKISLGLSSSFSTTQMIAGIMMEECARCQLLEEGSSEQLLSALDAERPAAYADLVPFLRIVRSQCQALLNVFIESGRVPVSKLPSLAAVIQGEEGAGPTAFSVGNAEAIVMFDFERLMKSLTPAQRIASLQMLNDARTVAVQAIDEAKKIKGERDVRIRAAVASALVAIPTIPTKPSALIKSIMDSIKSEENFELQKRAAVSISSLLDYYSRSQRRGPAAKIATNLMSFYCIDTSETPEFRVNAQKKDVILSLHKEEDRKDYESTETYEREARAARITRRGTKEAFDQLCHLFGRELFEKVPALKPKIETPLRNIFNCDDAAALEINSESGQDVVDGLSVLRALLPNMHTDLYHFVVEMMPLVAEALKSLLSVLRYAASKCFATICNILRIQGMTMLVEQVLPLTSSDDLHCRQGAIEVVYHLISVMEDSILPYVIFLLVPVLGRMSDTDNDIRLIATTTFATLVKLVPLEAGIPDPPGFPDKLLQGRDRERKFISQMLDPRKVEPFELPVAIKAELRSYQQEGVNWLAFLNRYHLHGILCDDMGLGKTLQTLCVVASDHHTRAEEYAKTKSSDSRRLPSLIVCPPTLSGHWQQEIRQFAPFLTCLAYVGPSPDRAKLKDRLGTTDIVITSYDICRNDIDTFAALSWNYCVLDEGHLIKNPKAKTTLAVKRLASNHRLILSGTPIQNNVLELWSLFDFLMPGFLGTEKVFLERFAKPIAASRLSKSHSKEQEAGALAIEALHKQVLPFLLRRLKEEVLNDLPPKILQNYYCDLSDLQKKLFDDFAKKEKKVLADNAGNESKEAKQHIFQALQYMRKLCNSPSLVVKEGTNQHVAVQASLARQHSSLRDPAHAPKLTALRDLLVDCGIGADPADNNNYVSPHRALIFCQMKEMLDIVATDVLRKLLPSVQFLRLDGSVEANKRQDVVNQFNTDPSYDCLLLTTSVGGLGLNLTGADTVIFVEHDWNPQKDIQAMDRAHRIGQKKVVNVYRLVTRGTLEEKILNLQRFKIDVASTVVNQQNAGLATMETDQILDLFNLGDTAPASNIRDGGIEGKEEDMVDVTTGEVKEKGKKGWLDDLDELWDEKAYEEEFDLGGFLKTMKM
ncbi:TATA-binding protein-associated factor mot1 [Lecanora helva]